MRLVSSLPIVLSVFGLVACGGSDVPPNPLVVPADAAESSDAGDASMMAADTTPGFDPDAALDSKPSEVAMMVDGACGGTEVKATARNANVLIVLDKSGSMLQKPMGFTTSKWSAVRTSLHDALLPVKNKLSMGLLMFPYDAVTPIDPSCSGNCCALPTGSAAVNVPVEAGATALDKIVAAVDATSPGGATPTAKALDEALAYFTTGAGKTLMGDKFVLLATDGGPNCNDMLTCGADTCTTNIDGSCAMGKNCCDPATGGSKISCLDADTTTAKITALATAGVKTFVVGIPGSEGYKTYLDKFAIAGGMTAPSGMTKYFAVDPSGGSDGLTGVFSIITGELITSCKLVLDSVPPDPAKINVYVDDKVIPQSGTDGWTLDSSTMPPTIVLLGATCNGVKTSGAKTIKVVFGCPTIK